MQMHSMILGDSDAGKTWVVLNILLGCVTATGARTACDTAIKV